MVLKCYCVDDLAINFGSLVRFIDQTEGLELVGTETDSVKAMDDLQSGRIVPDIIFLDIDMPGVSGMELAEVVKSFSKIIFTTAYADYAAQSYEVDAVDYLVKPITYPRFIRAVDKVRQLLSGQSRSPEAVPEVIFLPGNGKGNYIKVITRDIRYINADSNYLKVYTGTGMHYSYCTMKTMIEALPPSIFVRVHNSYIINVNHIERIEMESVEMVGGLNIPISRTYKDGIRKFIIRK